MSLKENFRVVKKMGDAENNLDRSRNSPGVEIEWDYSKSRLRSSCVRRKLGSKRKSAKDMRDLAHKLKQGCDENGMDKCLSPNLRSRPYKLRSMRHVQRAGGRVRKAAQARERLRILALQLESVDSAGQLGLDEAELQALCEGMDREVWDSASEGMEDVRRQTGCSDGGKWERTVDYQQTAVFKDSSNSVTLYARGTHHEACGSHLHSSVAKHQPEIRYVQL